MKALLTSREVCGMLGCSLPVLDRLERNGMLRPVRRLPQSGKRFYSAEAVEKYIKSIRVS